MGGSSSTRRISIQNEDTSVIKISDSVVHRIRNELQSQAADGPNPSAPKQEPPPPPPTPPPPRPPPPPLPQSVPAPERAQRSAAVAERRPLQAAVQPPATLYSDEAYISLMKLREEKDAEMRQMEQKWRDKINDMERRHSEHTGLTTEAFHRTLAEVQGLFMKVSTTPICQGDQERVMNCYSENQKKSLKCSEEVQRFSECVDLTRLNRLMR